MRSPNLVSFLRGHLDTSCVASSSPLRKGCSTGSCIGASIGVQEYGLHASLFLSEKGVHPLPDHLRRCRPHHLLLLVAQFQHQFHLHRLDRFQDHHQLLGQVHHHSLRLPHDLERYPFDRHVPVLFHGSMVHILHHHHHHHRHHHHHVPPQLLPE